MLACVSHPVLQQGQPDNPRSQHGGDSRRRWENPKTTGLWLTLLQVTILEFRRFIFFPVENCPLTAAVTSKLHHVSVTTTVSRFPLRVFLLVIKRRLPGSLFITWPESLKGNPFSNVSYGAVRWAICHCPLWGGRGWASSLLKGCLRNALLFSWPNSPRLPWNTIMLYHD